ncbi:hypothetical protein JTE90_002491 [Oedothorax gibbosus]|uniref:Uncharacterized protein n=1 Tax=Oedothorax gibbosus TaxID=931172 RepID=A0AAV6TU22_9ARAC|nr:hypothetical protein JTE90_002491 [Oedothorax gibbosus]
MFTDAGTAGSFDEPPAPLLPDRPVMSVHEYVTAPDVDSHFFLRPPSPPMLDDRMTVITNPHRHSSPWFFSVKNDAGKMEMASVVAYVPMTQSQFPDAWIDLLHRRYDGTCLGVVGTWRLSPHHVRRLQGMICIRLKDDHVSSPVPALRKLLRVTTHDSNSLYRFFNEHLDWETLYLFALIRNIQTPWCKVRKRRASSRHPSSSLGLPSPFKVVATQCPKNSVLFAHPEVDVKNRPDEPTRVRRWPRSRFANYLLNFSQDVFRVNFKNLYGDLPGKSQPSETGE